MTTGSGRVRRSVEVGSFIAAQPHPMIGTRLPQLDQPWPGTFIRPLKRVKTLRPQTTRGRLRRTRLGLQPTPRIKPFPLPSAERCPQWVQRTLLVGIRAQLVSESRSALASMKSQLAGRALTNRRSDRYFMQSTLGFSVRKLVDGPSGFVAPADTEPATIAAIRTAAKTPTFFTPTSSTWLRTSDECKATSAGTMLFGP